MAVRKRRTVAPSKAKKPAQRERVGLGGGSVDRHLKNRKKKKSQNWYSVGDGNTSIVRAVDPRKWFADGYVHSVEFQREDGSTYTMDIRCLDPDEKGKPCPGCRDDLERRYKFWMVVIVRNTFETESGEPINEEANGKLRILSAGNRLVTALNAKQRKRDLSKRDVEIEQRGTGFDVEYDVEWATDDDEPLTEEEQELIDSEESQKVFEAFEFHTALRDPDEFYDRPSSNKDDDDDEDIGERSKRRGSVFAERKKKTATKTKSRRDNGDDEDEDRPRRRRTMKSSKTTKSTGSSIKRRSTR